MKATFCDICGQVLTDPESIKAGVGPDCAETRAAFLGGCGTSLEEIGALALLDDATVTKWIARFGRAMRAGDQRFAETYLAAARRAREVTAAEREAA